MADRGQLGKRDADDKMAVWHWHARDRYSPHDLEYLVAAASRGEWRQLVLRMRLTGWKRAGTIKRSTPRFGVAVASPGHVFWRELGEETQWRDEAALGELRQASTLRELRAGRWAEPVHRLDRR